jgi:hypothetical protein
MRHVIRTLLALLVVTVAFVAGRSTTYAQISPSQRPVISGNDIGFRVDRRKGDTPVGVLVVRVNGEWLEPEFSVTARPATAR